MGAELAKRLDLVTLKKCFHRDFCCERPVLIPVAIHI